MWCSIFAAVSLVAGMVLGRASSRATGVGRTILKATIRGGMKAGTAMQTALSGFREELSDVAAEARAEVGSHPPTVTPS